MPGGVERLVSKKRALPSCSLGLSPGRPAADAVTAAASAIPTMDAAISVRWCDILNLSFCSLLPTELIGNCFLPRRSFIDAARVSERASLPQERLFFECFAGLDSSARRRDAG